MVTEHLWNDPDTDKLKYAKGNVSEPHCDNLTSHVGFLKILICAPKVTGRRLTREPWTAFDIFLLILIQCHLAI